MNKNILHNLLLGLFVMLVSTVSAVGQGKTFTSNVVTGNWSATSTWTPTPSVGDFTSGDNSFVIADGHTVTIDTSVTVENLKVSGGGKLIFGSEAGKDKTVIVENGFEVQAGAEVDVAALEGTHVLKITGGFANNGTIHFRKTSSIQVVNVVFDGTQTISGAGTTVFNNFEVASGTVKTNVDLDINGSFTLGSGGKFNINSREMHIAGNFTKNAPNAEDFAYTNGTVVFDGGKVQTISGVGDNNWFNKLTVTNGSFIVVSSKIFVGNEFHITGNSTVSSSTELHFCGDFLVDTGSTYDTNTSFTCFFRGHEMGAADGDQTITINGDAVFAGISCRSKSGVIGTKTFHGNIYSTAELRAWGKARIVDDAATYSHSFSGCLAEGGIDLQSPMRLTGGTFRKYNADPDKSGSVLGDYSLGSGKITVAGSVYIRSGGTLNVSNDVEIESGYIVLVGSYTVEGSDTTWYQAVLKGDDNHTLTVNNGTNLYMRGKNNFPQDINVVFGETSKAVYDSEFDQDIYPTTYGGLYLKYKTKTFMGNTTILNNLEVYPATNGEVNVKMDNHTHILKNCIVDDPNMNGETNITSTGTLIMQCSGNRSQYIYKRGAGAYTFNNLQFVSNDPEYAQTKYITGDITVNGTLSLSNNSDNEVLCLALDIDNYNISGGPNSAFSLGNNCRIKTSGANNFEDMMDTFGSVNMNANSVVQFDATDVEQKIPGVTYGNIYLYGNTVKRLDPNNPHIVIQGWIEDNGYTPVFTVDNANAQIEIEGNWQLEDAKVNINPGATVLFNGSGPQEIVQTTLPNVEMQGGDVKTLKSTMTINGNLTLHAGCEVNADNRTIYLNGNFVNIDAGGGVFHQLAGSLYLRGTGNTQTIAVYNVNNNQFNNIYIEKNENDTCRFLTDVKVGGNLMTANKKGHIDIEDHTITIGGDLYMYQTCNLLHTGDAMLHFNSSTTEQLIRNYNLSIIYPKMRFTGSAVKRPYDNAFDIDGDVIIDDDAIVTSGYKLYVSGNWRNSGTFNHSSDIVFDGANQEISGSTFNNVTFSGTGTKSLGGNINVAGWLKIDSLARLDVSNDDGATSYNITLNSYWYNNIWSPDHTKTGYFEPREGTVTFVGNNSWEYTGDSLNANGVGRQGKAFYNVVVNLSEPTNYTGLYPIYKTANDIKSEQNDIYIKKDLTINNGIFYTYWNNMFVGGNLRNLGGTFSMNSHYSQYAKLYLGGTERSCLFDPGTSSTVRQIEVCGGGKYDLMNDFVMDGSAVDSLLHIRNGELCLNHHIIRMNSDQGKVIINTNGTLTIDSAAVLAMYKNKYIHNYGTLNLLGHKDSPAKIQPASVGWYYELIQFGGKIAANHYSIEGTKGNGLEIRGGTIDAENHLQNGSFSGGTGNALLTLSGIDLGTGLTVDTIVFNARIASGKKYPTYNVERTSGTGRITFTNYDGTFYGKQYQNNKNSEEFIKWQTIDGYYWTGNAGDGRWNSKHNWDKESVPGANDVVILDHSQLTGAAATAPYTVTVDTQAFVKNLTIDEKVTLRIAGVDGKSAYGLIMNGKLNMLQNSTLEQVAERDSLILRGAWTSAGKYRPNGQPVVFASAVGTHQLTFPDNDTIGTMIIRGPGSLSMLGTINVKDSVVLNGGILIGNNATIKVGGDWIPRNGVFDIRESKVYFCGNDNSKIQKIHGGRFWGVYFQHASQKNIVDNMSVFNTFQIEENSATVNAGAHNIYMTGTTTTNWLNKSANPGIFDQTGGGSVVFNGTAAAIGSTTAGYGPTRFNNVSIQGSGSKYFYDIAYIKGSIEVVAGTNIVVTCDGGIDGENVGTLQMNGGGYYIYGVDNFAKNMASIDLSGGTVYYRDSADQKVFPTTYSGLYFYNEYKPNSKKVSTKTLQGDITVTGSITINDSLAILDVNNHTITLTGGIGMATKGKQIKWGANGTVIHVGGSWNVDADITDFCNVYKRGTGYLGANNHWTVTGNMDFLSETQLYMRGYTINCPDTVSAGKSFTMGASCQLHTEVDSSLGVAFPTGFATYTLDESSVTYLEGATNQKLFAGVEYGRVVLNNTAVRSVVLTGNTYVRDNFTVNQNNIKLIDNGFNLHLKGASNDLRNYLPTAKLYLEAERDQSVTAGGSFTKLYINDLEISGTGTKEINETNVYITGDINIRENSTFSCNDPVMFSGLNITNLGKFYHYGNLFTFTGDTTHNIYMGSDNQFYGFAVDNADTVIVNGNGINVYNGLFTLGTNSKLDMGAFTHKIASTQIDKTATSVWITENSNFVFNRGGNQSLPEMQCKDIQISTSGTKTLKGDLRAKNVTIDSGTTFSVGSNAGEAKTVYVSGSWNNQGTFTSQTDTVYFESPGPGADNGKTILSNESWFNVVVFNKTDKSESTYSLQDRMLLKDGMIIGENATVKLNGNDMIVGNDDPNPTVYPFRPPGEYINVLPGGHLYVDAGSSLLFDHNDGNTKLNVEGKLSMIGTSTSNAVIGRVSGHERIGTEVDIKPGATIAANYYQVQYLASTGFVIERGANIHETNNLSNGNWSNMFTDNSFTSLIDKVTVVNTFVYLTINAESVADTIRNLSFIHGGTPKIGTHFNIQRDTTLADTIKLGGNITGNMGYQTFERYCFKNSDVNHTTPITHKIKWPPITQIVWTGAVNSDWFNPRNWSPNRVPNSELSVMIPLTANSPIIYRNNAECKNLTIANGSLTIDEVVSTPLTVHGSVDVQDGGVLSVDDDAIIDVYGDWSIATKGYFVPQNGTVRFLAPGGSVSINPRKSDFNNIEFNGEATYMLAGSPINVKGDFTINKGLVEPSAESYVYNIYGDYKIAGSGNFKQRVVGFVNFAGTNQVITNGKFSRVRFSNSGTKTLKNSFSATYNNSTRTNRTIIVEGTAELAVESGALTIAGNVLIDAGATFNDGGLTHTFTGYYWDGLGGHSGDGTVMFSGNHGQYIYGGKFHNLQMTNSTKYINGDVTLTGDLTIYSCTLDMLVNNITGPDAGTSGTFAMGTSSNIYARGANNYPKFGNYTVTGTSKSYYSGPMNQTIRKANYGYLYLNSDTEKGLEGDVDILKDIYFYDNGGTLCANNHSIFVGQHWYNQYSGTFVPGTGRVIFNGTSGTQYAYLGVSVENPFYDIAVQKEEGQTFSPSGANLEIRNTLTVTSGKMSCPNGFKVFIGGDMQVSSDGIVAQSGCYEFNRESGTCNIQTNGSILNDVIINGGTDDCVFQLSDNFTEYGNFTLQRGIFKQKGFTATLGNSTDNIIIYGQYEVTPSGVLRIGDVSTLVVKAGGRFEVVGDATHYAQVTNNTGRYYFNVESGATIAAQYYNFSYLAKQGLIIFNGAIVDQDDNFSNGIFSNVVSAGVCLDFRNSQSFHGTGTGKQISNISFPNNPGGGAVNIKKTENSSGQIDVYNSTGMMAGALYENDPYGLINWLGDVEYVWTAGANTQDWFDPNNWTAKLNGSVVPHNIPTESNNVVIPASLAGGLINVKFPVITHDSAKAKKLTIERNASLTINIPSETEDLGHSLVIMSDMDIKGNLSFTHEYETVSVYGNWNVANTGSVTATQGTVEIKGVGVKTINNRTYNLKNLVINNNGTVQIQAPLTVDGDFTIEQGIFDVTTTNHKLTVGGSFENKGKFLAQSGTLSLKGTGTHTFKPGSNSYYNVSIDGSGIYTLLTNGLYVNHNLDVNDGTLRVGANFINAGDGSGVDYLNISGTLDLQSNARLKIGNNATIAVNDGGKISMIGAENNEVLVTSQNISGTYAFNINDGGTISAKHYKIERVNADGVHLMAGSHIDAAPNNMSDGQFVGGAAGGRYLWLENNLENADDTVTISRVSFNTGARYNAKRRGASAQGVIQFEDAVGVVASYYFEDDDVVAGKSGAVSGGITWSYTSPTLYWKGGNVIAGIDANGTRWDNTGNWDDMAGGSGVPSNATLVFIPNVSGAGGSGLYPVLNSGDNGEAKGITIFGGATLTIGGGKNLNVGNALSIADGGKLIASDGTNLSTIKIGGQLSNAGKFVHGGSSTVEWTSASSYDIAMNGDTLYNFTVSNKPGSTITFSMKRGESLVVENNFTIGGGTVDCKQGTLVVRGNFIKESGATFAHGDGTVKLNGSGNQTITSPDELEFYNLELTGSGTKSINVDIKVRKAITIGTTVSADTADIRCYGDWKMPGGGNYRNNFNGGTGTVYFCGTTRQTIGKEEQFTNVMFNNSSAAPAFTTNYPLTINGVLTLERGILQGSMSQPIHLGNSATLSGGGETAYINGIVEKGGSNDFLFPIGGSDRYAPIEISDLSASAVYRASYYSVKPNYQDSLPTNVNRISTKEYWKLERASGSGTPKVSLYWMNRNYSGLQDLEVASVVLYNANRWTRQGETSLSNVHYLDGHVIDTLKGYVTTSTRIDAPGMITFGFTYPTIEWKINPDNDVYTTKANWEGKYSPSSTTNIKVHGTAVYHPVVRANGHCYDMTIDEGGILEVEAGKTLTVHGNATIPSTGKLILGQNAKIYFMRDVEANEAIVEAEPGSEVRISGTANQSVKLDSCYSIVFEGGSAGRKNTFTKTLVTDVKVFGSLSVGDYTVLSANNRRISVGKDFSVTANGDLAGASTIELNGSGEQRISIAPNRSLSTLQINNSSASTTPQIKLQNTTKISKRLELTKGVVESKESARLTLEKDATSSRASLNSYVTGPMEKQGSQGFIFPLGQNGVLGEIGISEWGANAISFVANYQRSRPASINSLDPLVTNVSIMEHWKMFKTASGSANPYVTLYWRVDSISGIIEPSELCVAVFDEGKWKSAGNGASAGTRHGAGSVKSGNKVNIAYKATASSMRSVRASMVRGGIQPMAAANETNITYGNKAAYEINPLPIELFSFTAEAVANNDVRLDWSTASEHNNAYFTIEHTFNGVTEMIAEVAAQGGAGEGADYSYLHINQPVGTHYYRLHQTDIDGTTTIASEWVAVVVEDANQPQLMMGIVPNPGKCENIKVSVSGISGGKFRYVVADMSGQSLIDRTINTAESTSYQIDATDWNLQPSVYLIKVFTDNGQTVSKFVVE